MCCSVWNPIEEGMECVCVCSIGLKRIFFFEEIFFHWVSLQGAPRLPGIGWLRLVRCLKIYVSLQNIGLFCGALLHWRPAFLSILLIVATQYIFIYINTHSRIYIHIATATSRYMYVCEYECVCTYVPMWLLLCISIHVLYTCVSIHVIVSLQHTATHCNTLQHVLYPCVSIHVLQCEAPSIHVLQCEAPNRKRPIDVAAHNILPPCAVGRHTNRSRSTS